MNNFSPDILLGLCWDHQVGREDAVPPGCLLNAVSTSGLEVGVDGAASSEQLKTVSRGERCFLHDTTSLPLSPW